MIKYWRGDDMKIANILSRHSDNNLDSPNEIIPISFVKKHILHDSENTDNIMSLINMHNH